MSQLPNGSTGGTPAPNAPRRGRNLYLIEILLGAGLVALVVFIFLSGRQRPEEAETRHDIVTLNAANWEREVTQSKVPVVVDFWIHGCPPCEALAPIMEQLAVRYAGKVKFARLNAQSAPTLAAKYQVSGFPTVLVFDGSDDPVDEIVGYRPADFLAGWINRLLKAKAGPDIH